jgi:RNA polymerase primary sigma factor
MKRGIKITERITNSNSEAFKKYLSDVSNISVFDTPDDEVKCAEKAVAGDEDALHELVYRNLRFVISVAKQYQRPGVYLEDLVNEGNLGLLHAAKKFDPKTGNKFISYAVWWVRAYIQSHIGNNSRAIRIPINKNVTLSTFKNRVDGVRQIIGREPTEEDLLDYITDMTEKEILEMISISSLSVSSMDKKLNDDDGGTFHDILTTDAFEPTDSIVNKDDSTKQLERLLTFLKERDKQVLKLYFGFGVPYSMNLHEIADEIGMSREGVRQIRDKSLRRLKLLIREHKMNIDMF